jgi:hypothetical protein
LKIGDEPNDSEDANKYTVGVQIGLNTRLLLAENFSLILIAGSAWWTGATACFYVIFWHRSFSQNSKCRPVLSWPSKWGSDDQ